MNLEICDPWGRALISHEVGAGNATRMSTLERGKLVGKGGAQQQSIRAQHQRGEPSSEGVECQNGSLPKGKGKLEKQAPLEQTDTSHKELGVTYTGFIVRGCLEDMSTQIKTSSRAFCLRSSQHQHAWVKISLPLFSFFHHFTKPNLPSQGFAFFLLQSVQHFVFRTCLPQSLDIQCVLIVEAARQEGCVPSGQKQSRLVTFC